MKSKIFISINLPEKVKKKLVFATEKWQSLPVKWVKEANLHITLVYLGLVDEELIAEICEKVSRISEKTGSFDLEFSEISLFPSKEDPRMIALSGEVNEKLRDLVNDIEETLGISSAKKKSFRPHITLGRIRKFKWEALAEKPEISEKFLLNLEAKSADVMASNFEGGEKGYTVIESCQLG